MGIKIKWAEEPITAEKIKFIHKGMKDGKPFVEIEFEDGFTPKDTDLKALDEILQRKGLKR